MRVKKLSKESRGSRKNKIKAQKNNHTERRKGMKSTEKLPYEEAKLEVIMFEMNDIITYSGGDIGDDTDDIDNDGLV